MASATWLPACAFGTIQWPSSARQNEDMLRLRSPDSMRTTCTLGDMGPLSTLQSHRSYGGAPPSSLFLQSPRGAGSGRDRTMSKEHPRLSPTDAMRLGRVIL